MVPKLTTIFCKRELKSPIIVGASGLTRSLERIRLYDQLGVGAIITKLILAKLQSYHFEMRCVVEPGIGWHATGDVRLSAEEGYDLVQEAKKLVSVPIIANIMGLDSEINSWAELAKHVVEAGADMIELNLSCPNLETSAPNKNQRPAVTLLEDPVNLESVIATVRSAVSVPIIAKISSDVSDLKKVAQTCTKGGANAITVANASLGLPGVNIYQGGRPLYPGMDKQPFVSYFGPWLRPRTYKCVAQIALNSDVCISASGGIMEWTHVVQAIMLGASTTQICSTIFWNGHSVIQQISTGLQRYMVEMGYSSLEEIKGIALQYIAPPDQIKYSRVVANVDQSRCSGCQRCLDIGHCDSIFMSMNLAFIESRSCIGCGLCGTLCPEEAIFFVDAS